MKIRKLGALFLAMTFILGLFTGCGAKSQTSVYEVLSRTYKNADIQLKATTNTDGEKVALQVDAATFDNHYQLSNVSISNDGVTGGVKDFIYGNTTSFYLNAKTLNHAIDSTTMKSLSVPIQIKMLSSILKDTDYLKLDLPKRKPIKMDVVQKELVSNIATSLEKAGCEFQYEKSNNSYTLELSDTLKMAKFAKEFGNQMKKSSSVYAKWLSACYASVDKKEQNAYIKNQLSSLFDSAAKFYGITLTKEQKNLFSARLQKILDAQEKNGTQVLPSEKELQAIIEKTCDNYQESLKHLGKTIKKEGFKDATFKIVVIDNQTSVSIQTSFSIVDANKKVAKATCNLVISERKKAIELPKKASTLNDVTGNVLQFLEDNQIMPGGNREIFESLTEKEVTEFINSMFDSIEQGNQSNILSKDLEDSAELDYSDFIQIP